MGRTNSGRGGVPPEKRAEIDRLLAAGWEHTRIAGYAGVNVSTVYRRSRRLGAVPAEEDELTVRCGTCGGSIPVSEHYCRLCYVRGVIARARRSQKARSSA